MASPSPQREPLCATLGEQPMDVCFHPTRPLVAAGLITGIVELFGYTRSAAGDVASHEVHGESCRAVRFLPGGRVLASGGADSTLAFSDAETGALLARVASAHAAALNRLEVVCDTVLASGACACDPCARDVRPAFALTSCSRRVRRLPVASRVLCA